MTSIVAALGLGAWAGLGLVVPLGAIGVMVVSEGVHRGVRRGVPAAVAVASVDIVYCTLAVVAGGLVAPVIDQLGRWPAVIGGLSLVVVAVVSIARSMRISPERVAPVDHRGYRRFGLFLGLTAVNPATFVYFAAIALPLTRSLDAVAGAAFVAGVAVVSLTWQMGLIAVGALLGANVSSRMRQVTVLLGSAVVLVFGTMVLVTAVG
ncbi:LysE family transporter [Williamsia sp. CHRR-6]|uniref:LysE family transporter n=1 Tax=Williamsia sp. CHRR-6 TaxID=2835871 RepID=UPI001BDA14BE|nr:LysE family transporter [Williamsia sp. CHRR-6]MBT0565903.1 LysE family transporter [Williamsia sp. CHRR-6]